MNPYVNEEDLLGFHVFVAELELVTGTRREGDLDEVVLLELLQKLLLSVDHTDLKVVKEYQRRCEQSLVSLLLRGPCCEVRQLIGVTLSKLYEVADRLPLFSQVNALQGVLLSKDAFTKKISENAKLGMFSCLTLLCKDHGTHVVSSVPSLISTGVKHAQRSPSTHAIRLAASKLVSVGLCALGNDPRHAVTSQAEALKLAERHIKTGKSDDIRVAGLQMIRAVGRAGAAALWLQGGAPYEEIFKLTIQTLTDPAPAVRNACSEALGELVASLKSPTVQEAAEKETRENKKQNLNRLASRSFSDALSHMFCESALLNKRSTCVAIAKSWVSYLSALSFHSMPDENDLVQYAIELISILSKLPTLQPDLRGKEAADLSVEVGHGLATGEFPMAQACVLYALRTGVFRAISESGQRKLVDQLSILLASALGNCVPVAVCSLEGVRVLLSFLGEVSPETASDLGITFMEKLVSNSAAVRAQAAAALGSLVRADSACAATLITSCIEFLKNQVEQLTSLSARYGAMHPLPGNFLPQVPEVYSLPEDAVKKSQDSRVREAMHAVYGYATGLAALLVSSSTTFLSVPSRLFDEAYEYASQLIREPQSTVAKSWAIEMKAGYCILGALCVAMPPGLVKSKGDMLELFEPALGSTAQALILNKGLQKSGKEIDLSLQLWWRSEGLLALEVYIRSILKHPSSHLNKQQSQRILSLLVPLLEGLASSEDLKDPQQVMGGPGGWIAGTLAYLQLRLLAVFCLLPEISVDTQQYTSLVKLCSQPFAPATSLLNAPITAASIGSVLLRGVLDGGDSHLGPWPLEEEPLEEKLHQMTGERGAPHYAGWECGMSVWGTSMIHTSESAKKLDFEPVPFPQYTSLAVSLVQHQITVFGKLLNAATRRNRMQLLDFLISSAQEVKFVKNSSLQHALLSTICYAVLTGFDKARCDEIKFGTKKVMELSMALMDSGIQYPDILRGAAEISTVAASLADDDFVLRLAKQFCTDLLSTATNSDRQCFLLLSLGSLFRSKGGMCLQTVLPNAAKLLFNCIQKSTGIVRRWALHSLYLIATSAGLPFMPFVGTTLELCQQLLTSQGDVTSMRPYLGRLANAMVAILGPELLPGSRNYVVCQCLMRQMKSTYSETGSEDILGALEVVLYAQQLILFAPQAVPAKKHVAVLLESLSLPHPSLRYTSAVTLRHLTERDPQAVCQECIERQLFLALDAESEAHISDALHQTLEALQYAQCPMRPSVWLDVCSSIVMMNPRETTQRGRVLHKEGSLMREDELEEGEEPESGLGAVSPSTPQDMGRTPRLKTRLFACQCLQEIFKAVGSDPLHFNLMQARHTSTGQEYLVCQLQEIVRLGFSLSTGQVEALQPEGIKLLNAVIQHFGEAEDPDMEDMKLLFQFQAQFASPLRQALAPVAPPLLFMSGSMLAVSFLRSGLGGSDAAVLKQLVGLLVEPILNWSQLRYRNFSEWVSACVRVSLLEAHAHCTVLAERGQDPLCSEIVRNAQKPVLKQLKMLWLGLLTDYMVLNRWRNELWSDYQPLVLCMDKHAAHSAEKVSLDAAWPIVLRALALHVPSAEELLSSGSPREKSEHVHRQDFAVEGDVELTPADVYWRLLDITTVRLGTSAMQVIEQAKSEDGLQHAALDIEPICICLRVLKTLLGTEYMSQDLCPANICLEIIEMILSIIQQVIHPIVCSLSGEAGTAQQKLFSVVLSASELLLGIAAGLTESCMEHPNFISTLFDCILCCSSILSPSALTHTTEPRHIENGRKDCMMCTYKVLSRAPWLLTKDWLGTLIQHAIHSIGLYFSCLKRQHGGVIVDHEAVSDSVLKSVSEVLKICVASLAENGGEVMNGHETLRSSVLAAWTVCSLLDLVKKTSATLETLTSEEEKEALQHRLSLLLTLVLEMLSDLPSKDPEFDDGDLLAALMIYLSESLEVTKQTEIQLSVLKSLKIFLQDALTKKLSSSLTSLCIANLGPVISSLAHEKMALPSLSSHQLLVIADCLKYLVLTLGLPEVAGKEALVFQVLIPLLIESMECSGAMSLMQMSVKLVTHLNGGKHASSFKTAIGTLSPDLKQRFQKGIQSAVGVDPQKKDTNATTHAVEQKPSIVLKNFSAH